MDDQFEVRGASHTRPVLEGKSLGLRPVPDRKGFGATDVSFGVRGRLLCTAVLLGPPVVLMLTGGLLWAIVGIAAMPLVAWFLRDTWRRG